MLHALNLFFIFLPALSGRNKPASSIPGRCPGLYSVGLSARLSYGLTLISSLLRNTSQCSPGMCYAPCSMLFVPCTMHFTACYQPSLALLPLPKPPLGGFRGPPFLFYPPYPYLCMFEKTKYKHNDKNNIT